MSELQISESPLVSVVIPVYNRARILGGALESIFEQTYRPLEVVVVDDGSQEDLTPTIEHARREFDFTLKAVRQENGGPGAARRRAMSEVTGTFVQYLDSDDRMLPHKLARQVEAMRARPDVVMSYGIVLSERPDGSRFARKMSDQPVDDLLAGALQYRRWHTSGALWRFPSLSVPRWTNLMVGEDVVHDVSVGVHWRGVLHLRESLSVVAGSGGDHVSSFPKDEKKRARYIESVIASPLECRDMLVDAGLHGDPKYAEPLAERMYHTAFKLYSVNHASEARRLLNEAARLSVSRKRRAEILAARLNFHFPKRFGFVPSRLLFRVHRRVWSPEVHCYRSH